MNTDPRLAEAISQLEASGWAAFVIDGDWRLQWVSDELKGFLDEPDDDELGYGEFVVDALFRPAWLKTITPEAQIQVLTEVMPMLLGELPGMQEEIAAGLPEPMSELVRQLEPVPMPLTWSNQFSYVVNGLSPYDVTFVGVRLNDRSGEFVGCVVFTFMAVRPTLVGLLARGDQAMYERMAELVEPGRRRAAILFADLQASGTLSRQLASMTYFSLVRELTTAIDKMVADNLGVTGKHAGDGISAYFLVNDLGSDSKAAAAAISTAQAIRDHAQEIFEGIVIEPELMEVAGGLMNIGLHWGGSLFMGQLVPGGRLDVTALGDEVNECARIQESARDATILASKALLEHLDPDDAAGLGLDLDKMVYQPLSRLPSASDKAIRDAGTLAVTPL